MKSPLGLLQAKETQLPQPFLVREMLHSLNHPQGSALDSLKQFPFLLELRGPELDAIFQMRSHQGRVEAERGSPPPLLCPDETTSGILHPVLGPSVQEGQGTA